MFVGISNQTSKFGTGDIPWEMYNVHSRAWPWDNWQKMLEVSPIYHTDKAQTPLLIMHGEEDTRVDPGQSYELYRFLKIRKPDLPLRFVLYPGEGHGNRSNVYRYDYCLRTLRWFDLYLRKDKRDVQLPALALDYSRWTGSAMGEPSGEAGAGAPMRSGGFIDPCCGSDW